jgi:hypothetical protein
MAKREMPEVPDGEPEPVPDPDPHPTVNLTVEQLTQAMATGVKAAIEAQADPLAQAMKQALKPENAFPPLISAFNPLGDRDHPRPRLRCLFSVFDAIPIDGTTDTAEELALYNQLEPGDYFVTKSDGSKMPFLVREHRNDLGVLQRINISFPYRDEADRQGLMPMIFWLREVVAQIAANHEAIVAHA